MSKSGKIALGCGLGLGALLMALCLSSATATEHRMYLPHDWHPGIVASMAAWRKGPFGGNGFDEVPAPQRVHDALRPGDTVVITYREFPLPFLEAYPSIITYQMTGLGGTRMFFSTDNEWLLGAALGLHFVPLLIFLIVVIEMEARRETR